MVRLWWKCMTYCVNVETFHDIMGWRLDCIVVLYIIFLRVNVFDAWMFDVCKVVDTFRDTFPSWKKKACSRSSRLHCIMQSRTVKRGWTNEAFTSFLKLLTFLPWNSTIIIYMQNMPSPWWKRQLEVVRHCYGWKRDGYLARIANFHSSDMRCRWWNEYVELAIHPK